MKHLTTALRGRYHAGVEGGIFIDLSPSSVIQVLRLRAPHMPSYEGIDTELGGKQNEEVFYFIRGNAYRIDAFCRL